MRTTLGEVRRYISQALNEFGTPSGSLRKTKSGGRQFKIGKVEDENRELSTGEAETLFPGSTDAWAEIVPELYPDFPFDDPRAIKHSSAWFKIGDKLRVAFKQAPQVELAVWDPERADWFELEQAAESVVREGLGGSTPEESYFDEIDDNLAFRKKSVIVPDDVKKSVASWLVKMGLTRPSKKRS